MTKEEFLEKIKKAREAYAVNEAEKQERAKAFMKWFKSSVENAQGSSDQKQDQ